MSISAQQVFNPVLVDPHSVPETFVNGPVNLSIMGQIATLTFMSVRADVKQMFKGDVKDLSAVVVARLALPLDTLIQLRGMLSQNIQPASMTPVNMTTGSTTKQ